MRLRHMLWIGLLILGGSVTVHADQNSTGLSVLRAALSVYYGDTEGAYPTDLSQLIPRYLPAIPYAVCGGTQTNKVTNFSAVTPDYSGGWGYVNTTASVQWGEVFLNCREPEDAVKPVIIKAAVYNRTSKTIFAGMTIQTPYAAFTVNNMTPHSAHGGKWPIPATSLPQYAIKGFASGPAEWVECSRTITAVKGQIPSDTWIRLVVFEKSGQLRCSIASNKP